MGELDKTINKYSGDEMTKKARLSIGTIAIVVIIVGVAFALYLLFRTTETHTAIAETKTTTSIIICKIISVFDDGFFDTKNTLDVEQGIKVTFVEDVPDKLNYLYEGNYASNEIANRANDLLHADYNIYMGSEAESLAPAFSIFDNKLKINLLASRDQINVKNGKLFFLSSKEIVNFASYKDENLMELYESKGFSCKLETK